MTLEEALAGYLRDEPAALSSPTQTRDLADALRAIVTDLAVRGITSVEDFEPASLTESVTRTHLRRSRSTKDDDPVLDTVRLVEATVAFAAWAAGTVESAESPALSGLGRLRESLPRAVRIAEALSGHHSLSAGPFGFSEFLTTFEDGGQSGFGPDRDQVNERIEGYFRILSVKGNLVDAEQTTTAARVGPILFPDLVACMLEPGYVIDLELVHTDGVWEILESGIVYPPGIEV